MVKTKGGQGSVGCSPGPGIRRYARGALTTEVAIAFCAAVTGADMTTKQVTVNRTEQMAAATLLRMLKLL
jgi:hypothetical protein